MNPYAFPLLIKQLLVMPIAQRSRKEVVYRDRLRFDYPMLVQRIGRLGSALSRLGIGEGDTVAVLDWDSHRYLEAYFAVPMLGATLMTANIRLTPAQVAYTVDHSEAETVLLHVDFVPLIQEIRAQLPHVKRFICLSEDGQIPVGLDWAGEYEALLGAADPAFVFPEFDENTRATLFYTTGTTGMPKGVYFSHRQIVLHSLAVLATVSQSTENGRFSRNDVYMPMTPMFHAHAWGYPYIATMCGWKQVYPGRYEPSMLAGLAKSEGVTFSHCVPTVLQMVLATPEAQDADFGGWKVVIGGSALSHVLCKQARAHNIDIYCGYGMSESCPLLTLALIKTDVLDDIADERGRLERDLRIRVSAGLPGMLTQVQVVDSEMRPVPVDGVSVGEIVARAAHLTQGYLKDPAGSHALWTGGWMHTGDIGRFDEDGYLHLVDRAKDVIKSGGEWISSIALEDAIGQHPGVQEVAVIGMVDPKWGERPLAIVVPVSGRDVDADMLRAHLGALADCGLISKYAIPERFVIVETIERTSVGKFDKKRLREQFAKQVL
ncbi:long-chain fatty acid--CoA ligase [Burkholderia sp. MSh2]|uniref:AMP-binding protein n=1 Tax=Burkholderia paludis TaxID=1506587 RepID=A0A6J5F3K4_9BURK|nr:MULTISPECIES: fatty acid--CoA ligase [Burkholderia]KEZ00756.1 long-chain fatty acid--CoA ligase [Burkholderia sp. MSh2]CAB3773328.1 Long-chain-fatty-acid--CoA ligase [Burkholderia paludis]VWC44961.1 AMP-binding protein [Burkholderia paludis]